MKAPPTLGVGRVMVPSYRHHKASGKAVVTLGGIDRYLGPWRSAESKRAYRQVVAEHLARGGQPAIVAGDGMTVVELIARYWTHASGYYLKGGKPTRTLANLRTVCARLRELYGTTPASDFGPLALKAIRQTWAGAGHSVRTCNYSAGWVRAIFRWGVAEGIVPPSVYHGLQAVAGFKRGRGEARDTEPVRPVADAVVDQTIPHAGSVVAAMIRLQRLTGMRPGEVCSLTTGALDTSGDVWIYKVEGHKTEHHGRVREVAIGPRGQAVLRPFLRTELDRPVFSPVDSWNEHAAKLRKGNATRFTPSRLARDKRRARRARRRGRAPGDRFTTDSYRRAIERACDRAWPLPVDLAQRENETDAAWRARLTPKQTEAVRTWRSEHRWHPNQLRHTAATEIRRAFGLDAASQVLGHASPDITLVYAEKSRDTSAAVARKIG